VGKTHLSVALGVKAVEAGYSVLFLSLEALMGRLIRARHENRLERSLQRLAYPKLLILDELGCAPRGADSPRGLRSPPATVAAVARS
jgi:DNA replication protein DnaC